MKLSLFLLLLLPGISIASSHKCDFSAQVQIYEPTSGKFQKSYFLRSPLVEVTKEPHENPIPFELKAGSEIVGQGTIWTGTLLGTPDGDVIQAHARAKILNLDTSASVLFTLDSSMSKGMQVFDRISDSEMIYVPVEVKCTKSKSE